MGRRVTAESRLNPAGRLHDPRDGQWAWPAKATGTWAHLHPHHELHVKDSSGLRSNLSYIVTTMANISGTAAQLSPSDSDSPFMQPQYVMAERINVSGESEVLVVWKPNWIPTADMADMQVYDDFKKATHCKFNSMVGSLTLPVDRGSKLAEDMYNLADKATKQIAKFRTDMAGASVPQTTRVRKAASSRTLRKQRNASTANVTKATAPKHKTKKP